MAKGSFLGVKRGKIGDVVGYQVTNSADKDKQGWRPYQPKVRNPQSDGQMVQRCKMAAVNNLYRALKDVIRRGFENHKYGDESRRAWLKVALGQDFSTGPWVVKGSMQPVPIKNVPITVGSLPSVSVNWNTSEEDFVTGLICETSPNDVASLSAIFIANGYQEGDQVTIINGWVPLRLAFSWRVVSFYIDTTDTTSLSDLGIAPGAIDEGGKRYLVLELDQVDALAIAVSRDGDGTNLRSTSYVATNPTTVDAVYYGELMYEMAKRSYMNTSATRSTNWPIDPGEYTPVVQSAFTRAGSEFTPVGIHVVDPGQNQFLCIYDGAGNNYYIESFESSSSSMRVFLTGTGATTTAQPTGMTTANSVDVYDANNVAAGLRAWLIAKGVSPTVLPVRS